MIGYVYIIKSPYSKRVVYVGSTIQSLKCRLSAHLCESKNKNAPLHIYLRALKRPPIIELLKQIEVSDISELRTEEKNTIEYFYNSGIKLLNRIGGNISEMKVKGALVKEKTSIIRVDGKVMQDVKRVIKNTRQTIGQFYDLAAKEKLSKKNEKRISQ